MKKIFGIIIAVSAILSSCSSPYYPEYVPVISLGANTSKHICDKEEGVTSINVISNVEYTATIISGYEWLSFVDSDTNVYTGRNNTVLSMYRRANNHDKRVARVVLASGTRRDTVKIMQSGEFEDYLTIHPEDKELYLTLDNGTRLSVPEAGGEYSFRLRTSCLDHQINFWTDRPDAIADFKVENKVLSFRVKTNEDNQPRIMNVELSYLDGWDETCTWAFSIKQQFDPIN